jgi:hypothetical protein
MTQIRKAMAVSQTYLTNLAVRFFALRVDFETLKIR